MFMRRDGVVGVGLGVCEVVERIRGGFPEGGVLLVVRPRAGEFCRLPLAGCRVEANSRDCRLVAGSCRFSVEDALEAGRWDDDGGGNLAESDPDRDVLKMWPADF